jgi:phasin family protein
MAAKKSQSPFEIPAELRELTEKNIEQARAAYEHFMDFLTQSMNAWSGAASDSKSSGFEGLQNRAVEVAKENAERSFTLAKEVARAKDIQEILALQSKFAQTQMQTYTHQVQELSQLMSEAMSKAMRDRQ